MSSRDLAHAYTRIADDYDRLAEGDAWMRAFLWKRYLALFSPGQHVLDVGCGTGSDALFLAHHGRHITGIDISPGMIDQFQDKVEAAGLTDRVTARELSHLELHVLLPQRFDGILSAFAGLNTVPDLRAFSATAARLLPPGRHLIVHMLNRFSLYEWSLLMMDGRLGDAMALRKKTGRNITIGGKPIRHYLFTPQKTYKNFFKPYFNLDAAYGLGIVRPPRNMEWVAPALTDRLIRIEQRVHTSWPFKNWGRFFILEMTRRAEG